MEYTECLLWVMYWFCGQDLGDTVPGCGKLQSTGHWFLFVIPKTHQKRMNWNHQTAPSSITYGSLQSQSALLLKVFLKVDAKGDISAQRMFKTAELFSWPEDSPLPSFSSHCVLQSVWSLQSLPYHCNLKPKGQQELHKCQPWIKNPRKGVPRPFEAEAGRGGAIYVKGTLGM